MTAASPARLSRLSRQLSRLLRHAAPQEGLVLDPQGHAPLDEVLLLLARHCPGVTREEVLAVVRTVEPEKQRFSLDADGWIRANYGHSLPERVRHPVADPPAVLYHGTTQAALALILREGLRPMQRQYVHLTTDRDLARRVGGRRGAPALVRVDSAQALGAGVVFYRANPVFWLSDGLPAGCLQPDA
jgi:putative RNA 2'-phosphotransferase